MVMLPPETGLILDSLDERVREIERRLLPGPPEHPDWVCLAIDNLIVTTSITSGTLNLSFAPITFFTKPRPAIVYESTTGAIPTALIHSVTGWTHNGNQYTGVSIGLRLTSGGANGQLLCTFMGEANVGS